MVWKLLSMPKTLELTHVSVDEYNDNLNKDSFIELNHVTMGKVNGICSLKSVCGIFQ